MIKVLVLVLVVFALSDGQLNILNPQARRRPVPPVQYLGVPKPRPVVSRVPSVIARDDERPKPFAFNYDNTDEYGTRLTREESGDASGTVRGSYSYRDANGLQRIVTYIADQNGFRAVVDSNEPGLIPHNPADVTYNAVG